MCDTLCALRPQGALFAKNSNRPASEVQLIEPYARRSGGAPLNTQYLTLGDPGAAALVGSRPDWLWGLEHGVNEHRVAIGNEEIFTTLDPDSQPPALIGMDLVRLGLERGRTADEALDAMTALLAEHGQGGIANQINQDAYFSSFIIADPTTAWVLETSGRTWAARPVADTAAISNRLTIRTDWTRASEDVPPGADFDGWRNPNAPTGHADVRLAASTACLDRGAATLTPADLVAHLRDHGQGPWGSPASDRSGVSPPPTRLLADGTGFTPCFHVRGIQNTASSMVAELPADPEAPLRAWVAAGSPCVSLYVPVFPPQAVPSALGDPDVWRRFAALRARVEADGQALTEIRAVLAPLEADLWREADAVAGDPSRHGPFVVEAWKRVGQALGTL
jgi:secernin